MSNRTCSMSDCAKPHRARGLCSSHYNQAHQPDRHPSCTITCETCGVEHVTVRKDGRFCSLLCRDLWRVTQPDDPMYRQWRVCRLPKDHPVRVLIREHAAELSPLRLALEAENWQTLLTLLEQRAVKVDGCWLWPRADKSGYGRVVVAGRSYGAHRLSAMAALGRTVPSHMPVHHACAEPLCINPDHLQVISPQENTAEMLERGFYQQRIADLERALSAIAPEHPLVAGAVSKGSGDEQLLLIGRREVG